MVSTTALVFAALAAVASAAPTTTSACKPPVYTLPTAGGGKFLIALDRLGAVWLTNPADVLAAPAAGLVLKKIAIGHGIQNYTCDTTTGASTAIGALAVLYDATPLYPGTKNTGLSQSLWDSTPSNVLRKTALPLNKLAGTTYGADAKKPFPAPADLKLQGLPNVKFLGHHFFDITGVPVFDLTAVGLKATVKKVGNISAPTTADQGILNTGAVAWLKLDDNATGNSKGLSTVYRVVTAGGNAQACSVAGVGVQSVPYTTYYWFFG